MRLRFVPTLVASLCLAGMVHAREAPSTGPRLAPQPADRGETLALAMPPGAALTQAEHLARLAPAASREVLALGLAAMRCAQAAGTGTDASRLAVIDYSRSSREPRLWIFDLAAGRLLFEELVAHGQGSGDDRPTRFSNAEGSHQSSLGLFYTLDTYVGRNGYSLRMHGLDADFNDAALARAIVMHGASYVSDDHSRQLGRLGRSWGCPAVRANLARPIIDVMKNGQFVFAYYPDHDWLTRSALLNCREARVAMQTRRTTPDRREQP